MQQPKNVDGRVKPGHDGIMKWGHPLRTQLWSVGVL